MTAVVVIDNHEDLDEVGTLTHPQIDELFFSGSVPAGQTVQVPFLSASNVFAADNEFDQDVTVTGDIHIYGDLINHGDVTEIEVSTLAVESTVIFMGYGATASSVQGDRGLVFNVQGDYDPSFFWDKSANEFRLAVVDTTAITTGSAELNIFPEPDPGNFQRLHISELLAETSIFTSGSIDALDISVTDVATQTITATTGSFLKITSEDIVTSTFNANSIDASILNSETITAISASIANTLIVKDVLCSDAVSPFLVSGPGIEVTADPTTGQTTVSALMVGRFKFVGEIEELIEEGESVSVPGLNMAEFEFDDQRWDVYVNGVLQVHGDEADYIVDPVTGIAFNFDLEPDDVISVLILN